MDASVYNFQMNKDMLLNDQGFSAPTDQMVKLSFSLCPDGLKTEICATRTAWFLLAHALNSTSHVKMNSQGGRLLN